MPRIRPADVNAVRAGLRAGPGCPSGADRAPVLSATRATASPSARRGFATVGGMDRFVRWYRIRTVNVNVNIVLAAAISLGFTVLVMEMLDRFVVKLDNHYVVGGLTFVVDILADLVVYYVLHWLANHWPARDLRVISPAYAHLSFFHDATLVQFERALLSPLLYAIALGLQHVLLRGGHSIAASTAIGFAVGIGIARVLHTIWMVRQERRAGARLRTGPARAPAPAAVHQKTPAGQSGV